MGDAFKSNAWSYAAVAESVPRARADVTEFARRMGVEGNKLDAVRLAASEAVTNAVIHAYQGGAGTVQVCMGLVDDDLWLHVADEGGGLRPRTTRSTGLGLGLALIAQLASDLELASRGGGGTELRMRFRLRNPGSELADQPRGSVLAAVSPA